MTTSTSYDAPRTPRAINTPRAETAGKLDRRDALGAMFHAVDTNGDGRVDFTEAVAAACGVCASMSEAQAKAWFIALDTSDSGCIDEKEYVVGMTTLTNPLSDAEFATAVKKTIGRTQKKVKHPRYYFHESETRGYLGKDLVPLLEKGLESLLRQVEQERVKVASGELWDKDGYVPEEWRAMRPLQFLGRFLLDHSKKGLQRKAKQESQEAMKSEAKQKAAEFEARGGAPLPYTELTRTEKLEMCFRAIDKNRDAYITVDEMALVCKKLNPPGRGNREAGIRTQSESNDSGMSAAVNSGMGTAAENAVRWMDVNGDGKVSLEEYETAMTELLENVDDAVFDAGVVHLLDSVKFAEADRREKLKMVFDKTDVDGNGTLDVEELRHLARQLVVGGDEAAVKRTMKWLDVNEDSVVSFDEFCEPMLAAVAALEDDRFDHAVRLILELDGDKVPDDAAEALHPKLAAHVLGLSTHTTTPQITVYALDALLKDGGKKVAIVDCRPPNERYVSSIDFASRGSVAARTTITAALGDVAFVDAVDNNVSALVDAFDLTREIDGCDVLVCVSATGEEAGVASALIAAKLDGNGDDKGETAGETGSDEQKKSKKSKSDCRSLCGGVVAWFNTGYGLVDPNTGTATESVHPGQRQRAGLVRPRRNHFKFPKEGEDGKA